MREPQQPLELVLASASPRRRELLTQIGLEFEVVVPAVDESRDADESPTAYVERLARTKARAGFRPGAVALGADTTVTVDAEVLGKPTDRAAGIAMLRRLSGRSHEVHTAVAVWDGERLYSEVVTSEVWFRPISQPEAEWYWGTGEPADKAGGYGIQGLGAIFVERLEGSYSAVVGLPLEQTERLLRRLELDTWSMRIHA